LTPSDLKSSLFRKIQRFGRLSMSIHINPKMITWARERNRLTIEDLAALMKKEAAEIRKWELGTESPSYTNLEALSYRHLKIPLALFFFPEPPSIEDPVSKFRRLPEYEFKRISTDTMQMMRIAQGYQESLIEFADNGTHSPTLVSNLSHSRANVRQLAIKTRELLGLTIKKQMAFRSSEDAFKQWRHSLEETGIFTFKDSLEDKFISGFCLLHKSFPIIFINNSNSFTRQIFTLIHELGHILFEIHGVTDVDERYIEHMNQKDKELEIKCNQYAAEVLVPAESFEKDVLTFRAKGPDSIPKIAEKYSVSKEVILRRLLDRKLVTEDYYDRKAEEWNQEYLRAKITTPGGNYYLTKLSYLGSGFAQLAFGIYYQGRLTKTQLANHLNVNSRNLDKLESYLAT
jgi:Zn-dependent peptidase ImmA (M78 family)/transcriptional regulator with XRE-family HTH domain